MYDLKKKTAMFVLLVLFVMQRGAIVSEPAIQVRRKGKSTQVWTIEKLENKLIDMRDLYQEWKENAPEVKGQSVKEMGHINAKATNDVTTRNPHACTHAHTRAHRHTCTHTCDTGKTK